jgi:hypothetical protein
MILIGSAVLFTIGMLLLLRQAIVIAYYLVKLAVLLVVTCGCVVVIVVAACWVLVEKLAKRIRGPEPEPHCTNS